MSKDSHPNVTSGGSNGRGIVKKIFWIVVTIAMLGGVRLFFHQAALQSNITQMNEYLAKNAMFQAIRRVEPNEYQRFQMIINDAIKARKSQEEADALAAKFMDEFMQKRLRHGSAATLRQYLTFRVDLIDTIAKASPEACYDSLMTERPIFDNLPREVSEKIQREQKKFFEDLADLIAAPLSNNPIQQDNALATRRIIEIRDTLTDAEQKAFINEGKPSVDKGAYCHAYIKFYREALKLPEVEAVQVFRDLGEIPQDDRQAPVPR